MTTAAAAEIVATARANGLLTVKTGLHDNVLRVLVPLVIEDALLARGLDILENALRRAHGGG